MTKAKFKVLAFVLSIVIGIAFAQFRLPSTSSVDIERTLTEVTRPLTIESVPDLNFPRSSERFHAPDAWIALSANFDSDGKVGDVSGFENFHYSVSVPLEERYPSFPSEGDRALALQVRRDLVEAVSTQLQGIKFSPRKVNGKAVSSRVMVTAHFRFFDAEAPRPFAMSSDGCNEIELSLRFENELIWRGNTAARRGSCILD